MAGVTHLIPEDLLDREQSRLEAAVEALENHCADNTGD